MDEAVGKGLPEGSVQEEVGGEFKRAGKQAGSAFGGQARQQQRKIGGEVPENQAASGAAELGEGKRSGAEPGHDGQSQGKPWSGRVSWGRADSLRAARISARFCSGIV